MRRRLFTIVSSLSLLLCVAVAVLWVRSLWLCEHVAFWDAGNWCGSVKSRDGALQLKAQKEPWEHERDLWEAVSNPLPTKETALSVTEWEPSRRFARRGVLGLSAGSESRPYGRESSYRLWFWVIPYWLLFLSTAALPFQWLRFHRRRRVESRQCRECGYDLRATPGPLPRVRDGAAGKQD